MTLDKAIEILDLHIKEHEFDPDGETNDAIQLGIEALELVLKMRHYPFPDGIIQLPGETKE